jgi:hypothetical protein
MSNNSFERPTVRDELCLAIDCAKRETSIQDIVHVLCSGLWGYLCWQRRIVNIAFGTSLVNGLPLARIMRSLILIAQIGG